MVLVTLVHTAVRSLSIRQDSQAMLLVVQPDSLRIMTYMAVAPRLASLLMFM